MTILIPKKNIFDRLLKMLGKKRGVNIESAFVQQRKFTSKYGYSPGGIFLVRKESFFKALLRSKNKHLPEGMRDINSGQ